MKIDTIDTDKPSYFVFPGTLGVEKLPKYLIVNLVKTEVCSAYKVTMQEIRMKTRRHVYTSPRHVICYLLKKMLDNKISINEISKEVNRNHDIVIYAIRKTRNWIATDKEYKKTIQLIENKIAGSY